MLSFPAFIIAADLNLFSNLGNIAEWFRLPFMAAIVMQLNFIIVFFVFLENSLYCNFFVCL